MGPRLSLLHRLLPLRRLAVVAALPEADEAAAVAAVVVEPAATIAREELLALVVRVAPSAVSAVAPVRPSHAVELAAVDSGAQASVAPVAVA